MTLPFRNVDKLPGAYPVNSVVALIDKIDDAEAAVRDLDEASFGESLVYGRGEAALKLIAAKGQGPLARAYRAMQHLTDEIEVIHRYEKKVSEGASFIMVHLADPKDKDRVAAILKAHHSNYLHFLGRGSFQAL